MNSKILINSLFITFVFLTLLSCESDDSKLFDSNSNALLLAKDENFISLERAKLDVQYAIFTSTVEEYSITKGKALNDFKVKSLNLLQNIYISNQWLTTMTFDERALTF